MAIEVTNVFRDAVIGGIVTVYAIEKVLERLRNKNGRLGSRSCPHGVDKNDLLTKQSHDEICTLKLQPIKDDLGHIKTKMEDLADVKADIKILLRNIGGK